MKRKTSVSTRAVGNVGEDYASQLLQRDGYIILCRNYVAHHGEIDIIASRDCYLCFIEVKTRSDRCGERAADAVDDKKTKRILSAAEEFFEEYADNLHINSLVPRFDIYEIYLRGKVMTKHNHITGITD